MKKPNLLGAMFACVFTLFITTAANAAIVLDEISYFYADGSFITIEFGDDVYESGVGTYIEYHISLSSTNIDNFTYALTAYPSAVVDPFSSFSIDVTDDVVTAYLPGTFFEFQSGNITINVDSSISSHDESWNNFQNISTLSSTAAQYTVVSPVPVPAAVWLFGSALIGLAGIKRKK